MKNKFIFVKKERYIQMNKQS